METIKINDLSQKELFPTNEPVRCKPFLRWAGGKSWLTRKIKGFLPLEGFSGYHEPFLGGGAVFLYLQPDKATLSDSNEELIDTYIAVQQNVEEVIQELKGFKNTEANYYLVRGQRSGSPSKRAARFIYLNQTSYNGLYRVNLKGEYNVPYGFRTKSFLEEDNLRAVSRALSKVTFEKGDFGAVLDRIKENDLIFLDPPYTVSHNNNGFIKYNQKLFSLEDQYRLSKVIDTIKQKKAYYILTNAAHSKVKEIFDKDDQVFELSRQNSIGGTNAKRGRITEYLFTNLPE